MTDSFAWLIDPLPVASFEAEYYERKLCHVARSDPDYFRTVLRVADLDTVLGSHAATHPDIGLVRGDTDVAVSDYANDAGRVQPLGVARCFDEGATIVYRQLHRRIPALARLCVALGQRFASRVQTNVYVTPPHAQGFRPHWDTHDVFVLQVRGRKHWTIYDGGPTLPLRGQRFEPDGGSPGSVVSEFELSAGSVVYLPRGVMHAARSSNEASIHITLGLTAFTWADFLIESVSAVALDDASLRENLPTAFARDACSADERARLVRDKLSVVASNLEGERVWQRLHDEVLASNMPVMTDLLARRLDAEPLVPTSRIGHRPDLVVESRHDDDGCRLLFGGQELRLPMAVGPAIQFVTTTPEFTVADLPDCLDDAGKLTLVSRLVREGILQRL